MRNSYIVFGDSNASCFRSFINNIHSFPMSSAKGLGNPNSKTYTNNKIKYECYAKQYNGYIFYFGKVDIDFILTHIINTRPTVNLNEYLDKILINYQCFIKELNINNVYICELPISHLSDENLLGTNNCSWHFDVANNHLEKKIIPAKYSSIIPFKERNEYVFYFNKKMMEFCIENGYTFLEINKFFIHNDNNYNIPNEYLNENPGDHHLAELPVGTLFINQIRGKP